MNEFTFFDLALDDDAAYKDWRDGMSVRHMLHLDPDEQDRIAEGTRIVYLASADSAADAEAEFRARYGGEIVCNCSSARTWAVRIRRRDGF